MNCAIVYSSRTGNTRMLAEALRAALPPQACVYFGPPDGAALAADRLYVGFWTDRGACDADTAAFLSQLVDKEVFLFGTAGFGGAPAYFEGIVQRTRRCLPAGNALIGAYMCQGRMPAAVRARYERMLASPSPAPNLRELLDNFDRAASHPDGADLERLIHAVAPSFNIRQEDKQEKRSMST